MRVLLSLPQNLAKQFHAVEQKSPDHFFCTHDPLDAKLGSGGGTVYLLDSAKKSNHPAASLTDWLAQEKKILMHAGGQSRRLPAYAPSGKILTPIPVLRWARGQSLKQHLMDLQLPLLQTLMKKSSDAVNTLVACGDTLIRTPAEIPDLPDVDILCLGIWVKPELASRHGVFFCPRKDPEKFAFSLQKPDRATLAKLAAEYNYMVDVGIWMLSDKAVEVLYKKCGWDEKSGQFQGKFPDFLDLYGEFGLHLGENPTKKDPLIQSLTSAALPIPQGEFYHFGRSQELIDSSLALQNLVIDQRDIHHRFLKPHPRMFVMNAQVDIPLTAEHDNLWIENSHVPDAWQLSSQHLITGIPHNEWELKLAPGMCLDLAPIDEDAYCLRPYGFHDVFKGDLATTAWMGTSYAAWLHKRGLSFDELGLDPALDIQKAPIFPLLKKEELRGDFVRWMIEESPKEDMECKDLYLSARLSPEEISARTNLNRLYEQRKGFRTENIQDLAKNAQRSIFYQLDLADLAADVQQADLEIVPGTQREDLSPMQKIHDAMFQAELRRLHGTEDWKSFEAQAFKGLRELLIAYAHEHKAKPLTHILPDQIVWARSPLRLDLAGGWSDTPPYCLLHGGHVVNVAIEMNGQAPIQVYAKPRTEPGILIRSIDLSYEERIENFDALRNYDKIGEAFAIPKAALALAGFLPEFSSHPADSLQTQLEKAGGGVELSLLAAVPKGSGLGTSSILAATVLAALNNFYELNWDLLEIGHRTLILEQMLTSGGGWQDQYGGLYPGIKHLETQPGLDQKPVIRWLPEIAMTGTEKENSMLLYYTGITRVAHNILGEIVRGMFLNSQKHLKYVHAQYQHGQNTSEVIQKGSYEDLAKMIGHTWEINKSLDSGTNPEAVDKILEQVDEHLLGAKLLGAGGGGFLLLMAKNSQAALEVRKTLTENPPNARARFVAFSISKTGLQVTRS